MSYRIKPTYMTITIRVTIFKTTTSINCQPELLVLNPRTVNIEQYVFKMILELHCNCNKT